MEGVKYAEDPQVAAITSQISIGKRQTAMQDREALYETAQGRGLRAHANESGYKSNWISKFPRGHGDYGRVVRARIASMIGPADQPEKCRHCPDSIGDLDHLWQQCHINSHLRAERSCDIGEMVKSGLLRAGFRNVPSDPTIDCWPVITVRNDDVILISSVQIVGEFKNLEEAYKSLTVKLENEQTRAWAAQNFPQHALKITGIVLNDRGAWARNSHSELIIAGIRRNHLDLVSMEVVRRAPYCGIIGIQLQPIIYSRIQNEFNFKADGLGRVSSLLSMREAARRHRVGDVGDRQVTLMVSLHCPKIF